MEEALGIVEYVSAAGGATLVGTVKQRFTDFCVQEIDEDGRVAELTCAVLDMTLVEAAPPPAPLPELGDIRGIFPKEIADDFLNALYESVAEQKQFDKTTDPLPDKAVRTSVHAAVRSAFGGRVLSAATPDGSIRVYTDASGGVDRRRVPGGPPRFLRAVLWKEGMATAEAVGAIVRRLRGYSERDVSYAGTKDRRGVTQQFVVFKARAGVDARRLAALSGREWRAPAGTGRPRWALGNIERGQKTLGLGDLSGNRFTLVLRDVAWRGPAASLGTALRRLGTRGFVNYFGLQRFGTGAAPTHAVGIALLRGAWAEAVALIIGGRERVATDGSMRPEKEGALPADAEPEHSAAADGQPRYSLAEAQRLFWEERSYARAHDAMPPRCVAERAVLRYYASAGSADWEVGAEHAVAHIGRETRMLYVHAVQSLLWNHLATRRVRALRASGALPNNESGGYGAEVPDGDISEELYELSLPVPGYDNLHDIDREELSAMLADVSGNALTLDAFVAGCSGHRKLWDLPGAERRLLVRASDVQWTLGRYTGADDVLDAAKLASRPLADDEAVCATDGGRVGLSLSFSLEPSVYATMALREVMRGTTDPRHHAMLSAAARSEDA